MPYFYDCKTQQEAKSKYKELAKKLHPDKGGSAQDFKDMQAEYDRFDEIEKIIPPNNLNEGLKGFQREAQQRYSSMFSGATYQYNRFYTDPQEEKKYYQGFGYVDPTQRKIDRLKTDLILSNEKLNIAIERINELEENILGWQEDYSQLQKTNREYGKILNHWLVGRLVKWFELI